MLSPWTMRDYVTASPQVGLHRFGEATGNGESAHPGWHGPDRKN
jgi:hypothetical protein